MKVATQDGQGNISDKADFRSITTTHQSVAALQSADRRFHAGVTTAGLMKLDGCLFRLLDRLFAARFRQTKIGYDFRKLFLVFGRMKTPRKKSTVMAKFAFEMSA